MRYQNFFSFVLFCSTLFYSGSVLDFFTVHCNLHHTQSSYYFLISHCKRIFHVQQVPLSPLSPRRLMCCSFPSSPTQRSLGAMKNRPSHGAFLATRPCTGRETGRRETQQFTDRLSEKRLAGTQSRLRRRITCENQWCIPSFYNR